MSKAYLVSPTNSLTFPKAEIQGGKMEIYEYHGLIFLQFKFKNIHNSNNFFTGKQEQCFEITL